MNKVCSCMSRGCKWVSYGFIGMLVIATGILLVCSESMAMLSEWFAERVSNDTKNN